MFRLRHARVTNDAPTLRNLGDERNSFSCFKQSTLRSPRLLHACARPALLRSLQLGLSPLTPKWAHSRTLHTSLARLAVPSVSSTGQIQTPAYANALNAIFAELEAKYPQGRAVYSKGNKDPMYDLPPFPKDDVMHQVMSVAPVKGRCTLIDPDAASKFVEGALGIGQESRGKKEGRVVIEAFPGPGGVTRALLELPRSEVKRIIVLEEEIKYLKALKELEYFDDRIHVLPHSGFIWETYDAIHNLGLLDDVVAEDWKTAPHSCLNFIGHLPLGPVGEQLIAQLFRAIPERSWLFKYGRMRMSWLLARRMVDRITSPPYRSSRCKLTLVAEATANISLAMPAHALDNYNKLFFPKREQTGVKKKVPLPRQIGQPFVALNVDPLAEGPIMSRTEANELLSRAVINATGSKSAPSSSEKAEVERMIDEASVKDLLDAADASGLIRAAAGNRGKTVLDAVEGTDVEFVSIPMQGKRVTLEKWDYVLRQLFILKSTPLEKAIQNLGAGAANLLRKLTGPDVPKERRVDTKIPINGMELQDFARVVEEFDRWPFAPDVLFIADQGEEARN
ncbi:S-adenosyl-L-methionine-dependent methyltransferase [Ceratobasidium sp. AG-I]|nr:S-adenosyl-L-methionine-dependent methyltransferase [Ceratobasidium sp. AG-I]